MPAHQPLTAAQLDDLGDAVGRIAGLVAQALADAYPNLRAGDLVATFTRPSATDMIAARYLSGLERGMSPGEAAGEAGKALTLAWAEARLAARARLDHQA